MFRPLGNVPLPSGGELTVAVWDGNVLLSDGTTALSIPAAKVPDFCALVSKASAESTWQAMYPDGGEATP